MAPRLAFSQINYRHYLAFGAIIFILAELSRYLTVSGASMSIIWPPAGLMLGAGLALGFPIVVFSAVVLAVWLFTLQGADLATSVFLPASEAAGVLVALLVVAVFGRKTMVRDLLNKERLVYLYAGAAAATITAATATLGLYFSGGSQTPDAASHDVFLMYWLLEVLSLVLFAPLAFLAMRDPGSFFSSLADDARSGSIQNWFALMLLLTACIYALPGVADRTYAIALSFAFFPMLCWFVLTASAASVLLVIPVFATLKVIFSLNGLGGLPTMDTLNETVRMLLLLTGMVLLINIINIMTVARNRMLETFKVQANTDFLTGLQNERAFVTRIGSVLNAQNRSTAESRSPYFWLAYVQILDFDHIEDLMGFRSSRELETQLADQLLEIAGPGSQAARLGSGVYTLCVQATDLNDVYSKLSRIYDAFDDEVFSTEEHQTRLRVSIGAVHLDGRLHDQNQYLSAATQAALMARERLPRIQVIDDVEGVISSRRGMTRRLELLKEALSDDRLEIFAQKIMPISEQDSKLSYEILVRMRDPNGDLLSPGVFLPIAEAYGFMRQIDQWVIRRTLDMLAANPDWLERTRKCSINLAGISLSSNDVVPFIAKALAETGVPPEKIGFEVTETQQIHSRESAERVIQELRDMGCGVSLDDFGTGLATFDYLKSFKFDTLKIDGAFVKAIESSEQDRRIVKSICDVAISMGLTTVAEFVENEAIASQLADLGVDFGQGYGLGRPAPMADLFTVQSPSQGSQRVG